MKILEKGDYIASENAAADAEAEMENRRLFAMMHDEEGFCNEQPCPWGCPPLCSDFDEDE